MVVRDWATHAGVLQSLGDWNPSNYSFYFILLLIGNMARFKDLMISISFPCSVRPAIFSFHPASPFTGKLPEQQLSRLSDVGSAW